jgi:hypothetical protein
VDNPSPGDSGPAAGGAGSANSISGSVQFLMQEVVEVEVMILLHHLV